MVDTRLWFSVRHPSTRPTLRAFHVKGALITHSFCVCVCSQVCTSVCAHMHVCTHNMYMCVDMEPRGQVIFLDHFSPCLLRQNLSMRLELIDSARAAGQWA